MDSVGRYRTTKPPIESQWNPPALTSYGAGFDPSKIPPREWVIKGRYALGEGTAIAGPPGTNKSSLLLVDAVQITTGRNLLGDTIERTGCVLFLVGEDRRRDFEARLAGVCEFYKVLPAELRDRLHVVYQSEIDPTSYVLGSMSDDLAVLNNRMLKWIGALPGIVAVFIDPMLSWHRLVENDNSAMQVLCAGLRKLAVQTNIAVAFDHHVTKITMTDSEAHVGNLAAMRGGSAIGADMRWAFTMAKLASNTAMQLGVDEAERFRYRRLDTLKASYGPDGEGPTIFRVLTVQISNGEQVGVLTPVDLKHLREAGRERQESDRREAQERVTDALGRMLFERTPRSTTEAALWIAQNESGLFVGKNRQPLAEDTIRKKLPSIVGTGLEWRRSGATYRIVCVVSGKGNGARHELVLEDQSP